jgi:hypothetical protein
MTLSCPACSTSLPWKELDFKLPFHCPVCNAELKIPTSYAHVGGFIALGLSCGLAYAIGAHGYIFLLAVAVFYFPVTWLVVVVSVVIVPPPIYMEGPSRINPPYSNRPRD